MADDNVNLVLAGGLVALLGVGFGAWLMNQGVREDFKDFWYQIPKEKEEILKAIETIKEAIKVALEAKDHRLVEILTHRLKRLDEAKVGA